MLEWTDRIEDLTKGRKREENQGDGMRRIWGKPSKGYFTRGRMDIASRRDKLTGSSRCETVGTGRHDGGGGLLSTKTKIKPDNAMPLLGK